jgi:putative endonuclease
MLRLEFWRRTTRETGLRGEDIAERYLQTHGYRILQRNYRCQAGEIDIVAELHDTIRFVEVKTRSEGALFAPEDAVDREKRRRIRASARHFLQGFKEPSPSFFDIVSIVLKRDGRIELIELRPDAFGWDE